MAKLKYLIIHCSATPENKDITAEDVKRYHMEDRGWSRPGYSDVIEADGKIVNLWDYNDDDIWGYGERTWGAVGYNSVAQHVCYIGGVDRDNTPKDTRTLAQKRALAGYVWDFVKKHPMIKIIGHRDVAPHKACPSFDVSRWLYSIGIPIENIEEKFL